MSFEPTNLEDLLTSETRPTPFLIDGLFAEGELGLLSGQAKRNKTFVALGIGLSVAYGVPFAREFDVTRLGRVLMILNEDGESAVQERTEKLLRGLDLDPKKLAPGRLKVLCRRGFMLEEGHLDWLEGYVLNEGFSLVILDPFTEMFSGSERDEGDVKKALQPLKRIRDETGCAFLVSHHQGKPREEGSGRPANAVRGSSYFIGWYDVGLHINPGSPGTPLKITPEFRNREGIGSFTVTLSSHSEPDAIRFDLEWNDGYASLRQATARVRNFIAENPGAITREITKKAGGKESLNREALRTLVDAGDVATHSVGNATHHFMVPEQDGADASLIVALSPPYIGGDERQVSAHGVTGNNPDAPA